MVQTNMHPQVVEEVKAGKPLYFFSPPQEQNTGNCKWLEKCGKKPLKVVLKEKDHGAKQEAKKAVNFKHHCWGKSWRKPA